MSGAVEAMTAVRDRVVLLTFELEAVVAERERIHSETAHLSDEESSAVCVLYDETCDLLVTLANQALTLSGNATTTEMEARVKAVAEYIAELGEWLFEQAVHGAPGRQLVAFPMGPGPSL